MSPTKIFRCRILKQFVNQITLLCDGKCPGNAAKTILQQLIVTYLLNQFYFINRDEKSTYDHDAPVLGSADHQIKKVYDFLENLSSKDDHIEMLIILVATPVADPGVLRGVPNPVGHQHTI